MKDLTLPPRLCKVFEDYATSHQAVGNRNCHLIGIPLLILSVLGLLSQFVFWAPSPTFSVLFRLDAAILLWGFAVVYYFLLDWRIATPFGLFSLGMYFLGRATPLSILWIGFVLGWVFQAMGHMVYEKKRPAFTTHARHLLIGPLWVFSEILGYEQS